MKITISQMSLRAGLVLSVLLLAACGGDDTAALVPDPGPVLVTGSVSGRVLDYDTGEALSGVSVTVGSQTTTTGADGSYSITNIPEADRVIVNTVLDGYANQSRIVSVNAVENDVLLSPSLLSVDHTETFDPTLAQQISVAGSTARIDLAANSLEDSSGAPPVGNVTTNLVIIDVAQDVGLMPGDFSVSDGSGGLVPIESFSAAASLSFVDQNGSLLDLVNGQTATIRLPVSDRSGVLPGSLSLYYYNDLSGEWVKEGTVTLVGVGNSAYYQGTISHLSVWSAGETYNRVSVNGCVIDEKGLRVPGITVISEGGDYTGTTRAGTDSNGEFSIDVKADSEVMVYGSAAGKKSNTVSLNTLGTDHTMADCLILNKVSVSIRLTWGAEPVDLDAHLSGGNRHIYYANIGSLTSPHFARLDVDDTTGLGPEVITVIQATEARSYTFSVSNYSQTFNPGMISSPARVELNVNGNVTRYSPPSGEGSSVTWSVFTLFLNANGVVTVTPENAWTDTIIL